MTQERPSEPPAHPSAPALRIYLKHRYLSSWPGFNFLQFFRPFFASPPPIRPHLRETQSRPDTETHSPTQLGISIPQVSTSSTGFFSPFPGCLGGGVPHWWMPPPPFFLLGEAVISGDLGFFQPFFPPPSLFSPLSRAGNAPWWLREPHPLGGGGGLRPAPAAVRIQPSSPQGEIPGGVSHAQGGH